MKTRFRSIRIYMGGTFSLEGHNDHEKDVVVRTFLSSFLGSLILQRTPRPDYAVSHSHCDYYHNLALRDPFCFKMHPEQKVLTCLSRKAVPSSRTTSFSRVMCVVRLVGKLCFFDNFRPYYGEFNDLRPKTFEHRSTPNYSSLRQDMLSFSAILWF